MPASDFKPTVAQVGALLRARTQDADGNEIGTFDESTRPSGEQVLELIDSAVSDLAGEVSADFPEVLRDSAKRVVALQVAMDIEASYFPEQIGSDTSNYDSLERRYDKALERLAAAFLRIGADDESGTADDRVAGSPAYAFPAGERIGLGTVM